MANKPKPSGPFKDAGNGQFVKPGYAVKHPGTTCKVGTKKK